MDDYFTIGQMAGLCTASVQCLRYYDRIGLLKPQAQNPMTGYRYYSNKDIQTLRIIQDLKEMDFSLEEISELVGKDDLSLVADALHKKQQEVLGKVQAFYKTLRRIDGRLKNIGLHKGMAERSFEDTIEIKELPPRVIVSMRSHSDCAHPTLVKRFYELDHLIRDRGFLTEGFRLAVYHDFLTGFNPDLCDLEVGICLAMEADEQTELPESCRIIPGGLYATAVYKGEYQGQCSYLVSWLQDKGYQITGPGYEVYVNSFLNTRFPVNYITEVQFPVTH